MLEPPKVSPFLDPGSRTAPNTLAIVQLSRDNFLPVYLDRSKGEVDGYAEGAVLNTRFGSFPHSTLLDVPWGSQIRASAVDTGSRGRKRKRPPTTTNNVPKDQVADGENDTAASGGGSQQNERVVIKEAVAANTGFVHVLNPTPELWTSSLPHRTQVVYTPDYSYILHRINARPGSRLIEAGAGSGSFSHASARAVYNGFPKSPVDKRGKVYSFEFNEARFHKMKQEISDHNLTGIITLTHRDVYNEGFLLADNTSPEANAVFLDLPAPWEAIPHLSRQRPLCDSQPNMKTEKENEETEKETKEQEHTENFPPWKSPLDPHKAVSICCFSPCIEQVVRTIDALRKHGWVEIDMVELAHRRINAVRERIGLGFGQEKGASQTPKDVDEAISRLRLVQQRASAFQTAQQTSSSTVTGSENYDEMTCVNGFNAAQDIIDCTGALDEAGITMDDNNDKKGDAGELPSWLQGRLVQRTEPEIKTHTSYLTFAVLPREWTDRQEAAAVRKWPVGRETGKVIGNLDKQARKQEKRQMLQGKKKNKNKMNNSSPVNLANGDVQAISTAERE